MRIGELASKLGTTPHTIRFYEKNGLLPAASRAANSYREYDDSDLSRLRLLVGLRSLDLPLGQAAELASLCADGRCEQVSTEARAAIAEKRVELARRMEELTYLDRRLAHLCGELTAGKKLKNAITDGRRNVDDPL
ncbi:MAG TPA: MerR family transcriptional regulator [Candidatus Limnocylindrales bacterium]|nr:MerR family transcriptional regulator [Candidatus Limnocylindrales bacterium]